MDWASSSEVDEVSSFCVNSNAINRITERRNLPVFISTFATLIQPSLDGKAHVTLSIGSSNISVLSLRANTTSLSLMSLLYFTNLDVPSTRIAIFYLDL